MGVGEGLPTEVMICGIIVLTAFILGMIFSRMVD